MFSVQFDRTVNQWCWVHDGETFYTKTITEGYQIMDDRI